MILLSTKIKLLQIGDSISSIYYNIDQIYIHDLKVFKIEDDYIIFIDNDSETCLVSKHHIFLFNDQLCFIYKSSEYDSSYESLYFEYE